MEEKELDLDLDLLEEEAEKKLEVKNRYKQLSEKVITIGKEKEESDKKAAAEAERAQKAEKERDFFKSFSTYTAKYPGAAELQDKILEKVSQGYDHEDAILATLAKEGKLTTEAPTSTYEEPIGGSSTTTVKDIADKDFGDMTANEKLDKLKEAEASGELRNVFKA